MAFPYQYLSRGIYRGIRVRVDHVTLRGFCLLGFSGYFSWNFSSLRGISPTALHTTEPVPLCLTNTLMMGAGSWPANQNPGNKQGQRPGVCRLRGKGNKREKQEGSHVCVCGHAGHGENNDRKVQCRTSLGFVRPCLRHWFWVSLSALRTSPELGSLNLLHTEIAGSLRCARVSPASTSLMPLGEGQPCCMLPALLTSSERYRGRTGPGFFHSRSRPQ